MGTSAASLCQKLIALLFAAFLSVALVPVESLAAQGSEAEGGSGSQGIEEATDLESLTALPTVASTLVDEPSVFVSADVMIGADANAGAIVGSFTVDGLTFAVTSAHSVELVSVDAALGTEQAASAYDTLGDSCLALPDVVTFDGIDYSVTAIAPYAFYLSPVTSVIVQQSVDTIDERAFRTSAIHTVDVVSANDTYASFDGCLYDSQLKSLLLIPEGRAGAVLLPCEAEVIPPSLFSHCSLVTSISVEEGGAAFASWDGLLYTADGATLLRVPAGAADITIREGCTTVAAGAFEGCVNLTAINAPASVVSVESQASEASAATSDASGPLGEAAAGSAQLSGIVALTATDAAVPSMDCSAITVSVPAGSEEVWEQAGFSVNGDGEGEGAAASEAPATILSQEMALADADAVDLPAASIGSAATYAASYAFSLVSDEGATLYKTNSTGSTSTETSTPHSLACSNSSHVTNMRFLSTSRGLVLNIYHNQTSDGYWYWLKPGHVLTGVRVEGDNGQSETITATSVGTTYKGTVRGTTRRVYPVWSSPITYEVKLDGNGATTMGTTSIKPTYGEPMPSITVPQREGYTFLGYYARSSSTSPGVQYYGADGSSQNNWNQYVDRPTSFSTNVDAGMTLYAQWSQLPTYGVTFDKQGGEGGTDAATLVYTQPLPDIVPPTKTGQNFTGYYNMWPFLYEQKFELLWDADGHGLVDWNTQGDAWVFAGWAPKTYQASLDKNEGTGGSDTVTVTYGARLPDLTPPTRPGYNFVGYYDYWSFLYGGRFEQLWDENGKGLVDWQTDGSPWVFAGWHAKTYSASFDKRGGEGGTDTLTVTYDSALPDITPPTRYGYDFKGYYSSWHLVALGQDVQFWDESGHGLIDWTYDMDCPVYAKWEAKSGTVTFDKQGGSGGTDSVPVTYGQRPSNVSPPTRTGYTFIGYVTPDDGRWVTIWGSDGKAVVDWPYEGSRWVIASWRAHEWTATFDKRGGEGGTDTLTVTYDSALPDITPPTRYGYDFKGYYSSWHLVALGQDVQFWDESGHGLIDWTYDMDCPVYAKWEAKSGTVTFDKQGGSGGTDSVPVTYGQTMPSVTPPTRTGYTFLRYATADAGQWITLWDADGKAAVDWPYEGSRWVFAQFEPKTITLTWDAQGGSTVPPTTQTYAEDAKVKLPGEPVRAGWTFAGWWTATTGGSQVTDSSALPPEDDIYYARWTKNPYEIRYDLGGGSVSGNPTSYDVSTTTFTLKNPTRTGYTFTGWSGTELSGNANMTVTIAKGSTGNRSYVAHWKANSYAVEYYDRTGVNLLSTDDGFSYDAPRALAPLPSDAVSPGHTAHGWADRAGQESADYDFGSSQKNLATGESGDAVKRLYLAESPNTITITWKSMDADFAITTEVYAAGSKVPLPASDPTKGPGWAFMGWWTQADGGELIGEATPLPTQDATYYAHWSPVTGVVVPLEVTAKVDLLGIEEQQAVADEDGYQGYIESRSALPLKVVQASFEPDEGAKALFGDGRSRVFLEALPLWPDEAVGVGADVRFALDAQAREEDDSRLSGFLIATGYDAATGFPRVPVTYRFDIPDDVLASIDPDAFAEETTAVGQVSYTVQLVG